MKIWHISRDGDFSYDTYSDAVVCANTEKEASMIHPSGSFWDGVDRRGDWIDAEFVKVVYIGKAKEGLLKGVICASFNAG